jgi:hypothetical protein
MLLILLVFRVGIFFSRATYVSRSASFSGHLCGSDRPELRPYLRYADPPHPPASCRVLFTSSSILFIKGSALPPITLSALRQILASLILFRFIIGSEVFLRSAPPSGSEVFRRSAPPPR